MFSESHEVLSGPLRGKKEGEEDRMLHFQSLRHRVEVGNRIKLLWFLLLTQEYCMLC